MDGFVKFLWIVTFCILFANEFTIWWFLICAIAGVIIGIYKPEWLDKI